MKNVLKYFFYIFFSLIFFFIYFKIFSIGISNYPFPDETAAFSIFTIHGYFKGVGYYWYVLIGRISAMMWLGLAPMFSKLTNTDPWTTLVFARLINWIFILVSLTFFLRCILPRLSIFVSIIVSSILLSSALISIGFTGIKYYWLVDQSIYSFSFAIYCILMGLLLKQSNKSNYFIYILLIFFFLYLNSHEIHLISGGLILMLIFLKILHNEFYKKNKKWIFFIIAFLIYLFSINIQIFSPSLDSRYKFFPVEKTWLESIQLSYQSIFFPLKEIYLGFKGAVLPIILLGIGIGSWNGKPQQFKKIKILLIFSIVVPFILSFAMSFLSYRYFSLMDPFYNFSDAKLYPLVKDTGFITLPIRQNLYSYNLFFSSIFIFGLILGFHIKDINFFLKEKIYKVFFYSFIFISFFWLTYIIKSSETFIKANQINIAKDLKKISRWLEPLSEKNNINNKYYIEEPPPELYSEWGWDKNPLGHPKGTSYDLGKVLEIIYKLKKPVIFVPCQIIEEKKICIQESRYWSLKEINSEVIGLDKIWSKQNNYNYNSKEFDISTINFEREKNTLIEFEIILREINSKKNNILVKLNAPYNKSIVNFNRSLDKITIQNNGAFFLNGNTTIFKDKGEIKNKIVGRFVIIDDVSEFNLNLIVSSIDNTKPKIIIEKTKIRILETRDQNEF